MPFNSIDFAIFLPIVFFLYWFVFNKNIRNQNVFIIAASYFFYGSWDWRFLGLIVFSTVVDYVLSLQMAKSKRKGYRKMYLLLSLLVNLGLLGFFKYYNFFLESFTEAFTVFGVHLELGLLNIILPIGISFYTFQTLSYSIDVYRDKVPATKDFTAFAAFVCFFPQLVAGPIERASNLLPQFKKQRIFDRANSVDGLRQILWGLFKKIVIADSCGVFVDQFYNNYAELNGSTMFLAVIFFNFQLYGDFSGYSDIAIGVSRLFGFNLKQNFAFPYFSRDMSEFYRRWHISLSSWLKAYLYIPLGGSRVRLIKQLRNIFIVFLLSGLWHGANWTFVIWGLINAMYFLPLILLKKNRVFLDVVAKDRIYPSIKELWLMGGTFVLAGIGYVFFRSIDITQAWGVIKKLFSASLFQLPSFEEEKKALIIFILVLFFIVVEWFGRHQKYAIEKIGFSWSRWRRWMWYYFLVIMILIFWKSEQQFIYFQF
ncbi:MBOAT family O-acyltransferase [Carboxylicivirga sp. N1Y90]|uniref:MBOAT family O-acyltransferase n=1 Tax=Carboxylicivirga fragile TaxID=3417571 RepID=UPI003D339A2E|nr:MBOAT family protein [Marinilabiliaceae bacterium N1Y90]